MGGGHVGYKVKFFSTVNISSTRSTPRRSIFSNSLASPAPPPAPAVRPSSELKGSMALTSTFSFLSAYNLELRLCLLPFGCLGHTLAAAAADSSRCRHPPRLQRLTSCRRRRRFRRAPRRQHGKHVFDIFGYSEYKNDLGLKQYFISSSPSVATTGPSSSTRTGTATAMKSASF